MNNVVILNDTSGGHIGCNLVMDNLKRLLDSISSLRIIANISRKDIGGNKKQVIKHIQDSHLVIINGEGTFHHSKPIIHEYLELCKPKPTILLNTSWDKVYTDNLDIVREMELIAVRENKSYEQLSKIVDTDKLMLVPDLSFMGLPPSEKIGYSDSVMNTLRNWLKDESNYYPLAPDATTPSIDTYVTWLKSLDLFITGRFHGVCLASMLGVPFLAFPSNSHKIEGLLEDMSCIDLLISDLKEVDNKKPIVNKMKDKIYNYVKVAPNKINTLKDKIERISNEMENIK